MQQEDKVLNDFLDLNYNYKKRYYKKNKNYDIFITIPKGRKYFLWLKNNTEYYYFFEHDTFNNKIKKGFNIKSNKKIAFGNINGTLLFGTCFQYENSNFFNIEDIFYYNDKYILNNSYLKKISIIKKILDNLHSEEICIGLPIIKKNKDELLKEIKKIPYKIYYIQHKFLKKNNYIFNEKLNEREKTLVFLVKATNYPDNYVLHYKENNKYISYESALIPNINISFFMNKLFRKNNENDNIDLIEESDDEENFENINENKYLIDNKEIKMKCLYSNKFNSWIPINVCKKKICNKKHLCNNIIKN